MSESVECSIATLISHAIDNDKQFESESHSYL